MEKELRELFCLKIGLENAQFKKRMLKQSAEVLFERAYQIDTMFNLYELLIEMSQKMELEVLKTLLVFPNLLAFLYDRWLKEEDSHIEELQSSIEKNVGELQEKYQKVKRKEWRKSQHEKIGIYIEFRQKGMASIPEARDWRF